MLSSEAGNFGRCALISRECSHDAVRVQLRHFALSGPIHRQTNQFSGRSYHGAQIGLRPPDRCHPISKSRTLVGPAAAPRPDRFAARCKDVPRSETQNGTLTRQVARSRRLPSHIRSRSKGAHRDRPIVKSAIALNFRVQVD